MDLSESGINFDVSDITRNEAVQRLEAQGLPEWVQFSIESYLGMESSKIVSSGVWREVAQQIISDPSLAKSSATLFLPADDDLASGLKGEGSPEMQALASQLLERGILASNFDPGFLSRSDATSTKSWNMGSTQGFNPYNGCNTLIGISYRGFGCPLPRRVRPEEPLD